MKKTRSKKSRDTVPLTNDSLLSSLGLTLTFSHFKHQQIIGERGANTLSKEAVYSDFIHFRKKSVNNQNLYFDTH